jgi:hypothetical protein
VWLGDSILPSGTFQRDFCHAHCEAFLIVAIGLFVRLEAGHALWYEGLAASGQTMYFVIESRPLNQQGGRGRKGNRSLFSMANGAHTDFPFQSWKRFKYNVRGAEAKINHEKRIPHFFRNLPRDDALQCT